MNGQLIYKWKKDFPNTSRVDFFSFLHVFLRHMLIRHKKKTGGGFSKVVQMEDGTELNVNTNKCEGLWAHLKHKTKRIYGTSTNLTDSYMMEALFRQNARARGETVASAFLKMLKKNYSFDYIFA